MSGASHTPGPWEIYPAPIASAQEAKDLICEQVDMTSPVGSVLYMLNAGGKCPATTGCGPTSEANARLIAAAPDGFDVISRFRRKLKTYVSVYPGDKELRGLLADCDAYLAKARGEA